MTYSLITDQASVFIFIYPVQVAQIKSFGIHSKSEKVFGIAFSVKKKIAEKVRKYGRKCGAVCSMTNPSQSNQISMTNFARSQQKKLRKICGNFKFFCGIVGVQILAFRMYGYDL